MSQVEKASFFDMEKVEVTIKQFYRDWSKEVDKINYIIQLLYLY